MSLNSVEDQSLVYSSPSEKLINLKVQNLEFTGFNEEELDSTENLELPLSNKVDILSPEEGSITRYANIFEDLEGEDSDNEEFNHFLKDSYSDSFVPDCNRQRNDFNDELDDFNYTNYQNVDKLSEKSLTFSDRVAHERQRMIRKEILFNLNSNHFPHSQRRRRLKKVQRPHLVEKSFRFLEEDSTYDSIQSQIIEKHTRIDDLLKNQQEKIREIRLNSSSNSRSTKDEALLYVKQENARLLSDNEKNCEFIKTLQIEIEDLESNLVVERKQNEQLLKDKVDLQNRVNLLSKENRSLLSSQEMLQNMHKNEVEELKTKRQELSNKVSKLEKDLDYFRDNLHESHKINEILKTEVSSLTELYKNDRAYLKKLKIENKRLMENNSIYKSQNYSLIEINERLRNRTLFRINTGDLTSSNSSTATNRSSTQNIPYNSCLSSPNSDYTSRIVNDKELIYLDKLSQSSENNVNNKTDSPTLTKLSDDYQVINSPSNTPQSISSKPNNLFSNSNGVSINPNAIISQFNNIVLNTINDDEPQNNLLDSISDTNFDSTLSDNQFEDIELGRESNYNVVRIVREDSVSNPTIKWVVDRVSRNSSFEALESLREKIRSITSECNVQNVNINTSLKCFQNNVTINLIQNKLQLISQRLNETIV